MRKHKSTLGATATPRFIESFAYGDKTSAIRSLIAASLSSHRFDGVTSDDFIYEALAAGTVAEPLAPEGSQAV